MKRGSTNVLRVVVLILGIIVLGICIFALPQLIHSEVNGDFDYGPIFLGMYVPAVPFFIGLYQAWLLLRYIDRNEAFSDLAVQALRKIKYCAFAISALYALGMPYIFYVADRDDAPGVAAIGFVIIGASFVIATAGAVFQKLFQNAVDIKNENDLTV
jgi:hypothetical protein